MYGSCRLGAVFICIFVCVIQTSKVYPIRDNELNQWSSICYITKVIGMLVTIVILNV